MGGGKLPGASKRATMTAPPPLVTCHVGGNGILCEMGRLGLRLGRFGSRSLALYGGRAEKKEGHPLLGALG